MYWNLSENKEKAFEDGINLKNARNEDANRVDNILMNPVLVLIVFSTTTSIFSLPYSAASSTSSVLTIFSSIRSSNTSSIFSTSFSQEGFEDEMNLNNVRNDDVEDAVKHDIEKTW